MEDKREFCLDLHENELCGYEPVKSRLVVLAMEEGVKLRMKFPLVAVIKVAKKKYNIVAWWEGGHDRALAHYRQCGQLRCFLEDGNPWGGDKCYFPIKEIILSDDINLVKLKDSLRHLPRDVAERFCRENDLNPNKYLPQ